MTPARRVLTEKRRLIWPIGIVLVLNAAVFLIVVYPLAQKVAGGEQQASAATAALNSARRDEAAARGTIKGKAEADAELQKFYEDVLPVDISGARRITYLWIEQLARRTNLRLERETSDAKPQRDSQLLKFTFTATLSGEYRDIRHFIHELEAAPEFLVLENVGLSQNEGEAKGINVMVEIATYFRGMDGDGR